uniref:Uncharacterized protein n=1 Tax=Helianthus annuus TaxID=4232 RepID=A0A251VSB9_HELAN
MPASCSPLSLSTPGDSRSRSGSRVFLHHVSTTPIPHGNPWNQTQELKMMQAVVLIGGG